MAKVILCIHGRSPKPTSDVLLDWCRSSIEEGLQKNLQRTLGELTVDLAYYADIYYQPFAASADKEPYKPAADGALKRHKLRIVDKVRGISEDWIDTPLDWLEEKSSVFSGLAREVAKRNLEDLAAYYKDAKLRALVQKRLLDKLTQYKDEEIILVSHSMGTIVAYEVLTQLDRDIDGHDLRVPHFISLGSPLGLTPVKGEILKRGAQEFTTPLVVTKSWHNFSDPQDYVCLDNHLADDYVANPAGITVQDTIIANDYPGNPHKMYGYLRAPEFSEVLVSL